MVNQHGATNLSTLSKREINQALDLVIEARRSIREFRLEKPPKELIDKVIQAGLLAPYSGLAVSRRDFRQFIVIPSDSKATPQIALLLGMKILAICKQLEKQMEHDLFLKERGRAFCSNLKAMSQHGIPNIGKAPYYIIVAEQKGIPAVEQRSLSHCMQNMWLKSTALGLGFQLLSITAQMAEDKEFCDLLKIQPGEFALDGCLIGYPETLPPPVKRPKIDEISRWIE